MKRRSKSGFTLAELLIALGILGVIAAFTIPKILAGSQDSRYNAMAKEVASTLGSAYDTYSKTNTVSSSTKISDLTPYMNYVAVDTSTVVHDHPGYVNQTCGATFTCLKMHNGGMVWWRATISFSGTSSTNAIYVNFDPNPTATSAGDAVQLHLFYGGRVSSAGQSAGGDSDPSWFSW